MRDNEKGTYILIDVAMSGGTNMTKKKAANILKCKGLTTQIQRTWNVKPKLMPIIKRATGTISKSFRKYLSDIT
jgi:hypothetical protein